MFYYFLFMTLKTFQIDIWDMKINNTNKVPHCPSNIPLTSAKERKQQKIKGERALKHRRVFLTCSSGDSHVSSELKDEHFVTQ